VWPDGASGEAGRTVAPARPPGTWPTEFVRDPADREALLVLAHLEAMTPGDLHLLALREGTAERCLAAVRRGRVSTDGDRTIAGEVDPAAVREDLDRIGARAVCPGDAEYPAGLLDLHDPPACLFVRGTPVAEGPSAVAIVGARRCTPYGREVAEAFGAGLASAGLVVVSGAARGVDAAAHVGALRASGRTAAVLGSGIDVAYPAGNRDLIERIAASGTVVSEYPPGVEALPRRFPARNRIVAGLSRGVVVVEGAEGSGSLITAEFAGDLHREVMAVPGPVTGPLSAAPHELIRDGATLVTSVADVVAVLGTTDGPDGSARSRTLPAGPPAPAGLTDQERGVLDRLPGSPVTLDAVAAITGMDAGRALGALAALELRGLVSSEGGRYRRTGPPGSAGANHE
jgi:DNA processing protein